MAYNPGPQGDDKPGCICILIPIPRLLAQLVERAVEAREVLVQIQERRQAQAHYLRGKRATPW